ncbi:hypothetical protein [Citrobacter freundii]|uniref:hypothetical protein n=1 Tax=Citrobacter freundii TaxID=546 RepID=UPI001903480B|nr:hypothetical protein [Citrobacter freundii]MBJ9200743.1 hypothetical protein [Citrobacter freundii]HED1546179.1 hypothetical protein [Citrobacter freundii]
MLEFVESVKKSLLDKNYEAALFIALSLPDICGKLETPEERNGPRAKRWFKDNLKNKYFADNLYETFIANYPEQLDGMPQHQIERLKTKKPLVKLDPENYWALRNAFLHEASDSTKLQQIQLTHSSAHMNMFNGVLQLSVINLSNDICDAVVKWVERMKDNDEVWQRINSRAQIKNEMSNGAIRFE